MVRVSFLRVPVTPWAFFWVSWSRVFTGGLGVCFGCGFELADAELLVVALVEPAPAAPAARAPAAARPLVLGLTTRAPVAGLVPLVPVVVRVAPVPLVERVAPPVVVPEVRVPPTLVPRPVPPSRLLRLPRPLKALVDVPFWVVFVPAEAPPAVDLPPEVPPVGVFPAVPLPLVPVPVLLPPAFPACPPARGVVGAVVFVELFDPPGSPGMLLPPDELRAASAAAPRRFSNALSKFLISFKR